MREPYHSKQWRDLRLVILERDGWACQWPDGCDARGDQVDHIIPWREAPALAFDTGNLRALCKFHNSSRVRRPNDRVMSDAGRRPSREW